MTEQEFQTIYPVVSSWIRRTLEEHRPGARTVASYGFNRLSLYYRKETLSEAKVVEVPEVPVPPLSAIGITQFQDFERRGASGITYLDTYFVRADAAQSESLHFHELIHIIQWSLLGPEKFLTVYADGLERNGYRNSPLEVMAYDLQSDFDNAQNPFGAEACVQKLLVPFLR